MYSTCIFCHRSLGANEAVEHFPVGRRLAFDAQKGRLWVVCASCDRWNLTPIEERWEAVEECERAFRQTRLRASTENIGLAKVRDGTTLVRIGAPQRPEMAAWRYGDQLSNRRRRFQVAVGVSLGTTAALCAAMMTNPVAIVGWPYFTPAMLLYLFHDELTGMLPEATQRRLGLRPSRVTLRTEEQIRRVRSDLLWDVRFRAVGSSDFELEIPAGRFLVRTRWDAPNLIIRGDAALHAARHLMPHINLGGGKPEVVREAVDLVGDAPSARELFQQMALAQPRSADDLPWQRRRSRRGAHERLIVMAPARRLALEMALHESDERRALEGELAELETRWREAEEVARIADGLLVPDTVEQRIAPVK